MGKVSVSAIQTEHHPAAIPKEVTRLIEQFREHHEAYQSGQYNEAQLRQEFINPFFEVLGWDVHNKQGHAEAYKDVIHEDSIKIGGATKAPDYCFRIGGLRKFFVEAKKPSVNLKEDTRPAYQLRRYAWSAKLPLGILTDFEEFAVYDCRTKPLKTDGPATARVLYFTYESYAERWPQIASIFSHKAVLKGSFDKYVDSTKTKRGTVEVDSVFLKEIESWRETLARNLALRNPTLSQRELNFAVQRTVDRIIFLRICEDRGIESYGRLLALTNGAQIYPRLSELFQRADERYNSGLFQFHKEKDRFEPPDELTLKLKFDDEPLKDILKSLYYPDSPYEFSVLPADILGQVYEQFLGKVIRLTPGHRAVVEDKPEVKKAGGVYYTPTYIVDYIVKNTVGKLLEGKKPKQVTKLKILDPACGSGSFLIGAYQYLLDWHRDWYAADGPDNWTKGRSPVLYQAGGGDWRLTTTERRRILLNNIYGVDIDPQAVEVTKLSLSLKVLEGENEQTLSKQFELFHERALPDLASNIKCGNSLIGPDFYEGKQLNLFNEEERHRVNAFDWNTEFSEIMKSGGFDAVIGNPPYLFITELEETDKKYFSQVYLTCEYRFDVYGLFAELSVKTLLEEGGLLAFITPHTLLSNDSFEKLRRYLLKETCLRKVVDIGPGVFQRARNETMIFVAEKKQCQQRERFQCEVILTSAKGFMQSSRASEINQDEWLKNPHATWDVRISQNETQVLTKLDAVQVRLGQICTINQGLRTGDNKKYLSREKLSGVWEPAVGGKDVGRYEPLRPEAYVYYDPAVLDAPRKREIFTSNEKLVVQEIRNITLPRRIVAAYDDKKFYCLQSTNVINQRYSIKTEWRLKYLLGVLNSTLVNFFFRHKFSGNNHIASNQLAQIPVACPTLQQQEEVSNLVVQILSLNNQSAAAKTPDEKTRLERQIAATDRQINQLVYELYGLTEDEIRIVEADTKPK